MPVMSAATSRRSLLKAGASVLVLTGCTSGRGRPNPAPTGSALTTPDEVARRAAAGLELTLAANAKASGATASAKAHTAHVAALLEGLTTPSAVAGKASSAASLAQAQTAAAGRHQAALASVSAELARLLASIAASDLSFAAVLRGTGR